MVVQCGVEVEAVGPVSEPQAQIGSLPATVCYFYHEVPEKVCFITKFRAKKDALPTAAV